MPQLTSSRSPSYPIEKLHSSAIIKPRYIHGHAGCLAPPHGVHTHWLLAHVALPLAHLFAAWALQSVHERSWSLSKSGVVVSKHQTTLYLTRLGSNELGTMTALQTSCADNVKMTGQSSVIRAEGRILGCLGGLMQVSKLSVLFLVLEKSGSAFFSQAKDNLRVKRLTNYIVLEGTTNAIISLYVRSFASDFLLALTCLRAGIQ